jgi:hypothetical protein
MQSQLKNEKSNDINNFFYAIQIKKKLRTKNLFEANLKTYLNKISCDFG